MEWTTDLPSVCLRKDKEKIRFTKHQWIFSGAIEKIDGAKPGHPVVVLNSKGETLGWGFFEDGDISVRVFDWGLPPKSLSDFFGRAIAAAMSRRKKINLPSQDTTGFRLIFGEADNLPSIIVDIYENVVVVQIQSKGVWNYKEYFLEELQKASVGEYIFLRNDPLFTPKGNSPKGTFYGKETDITIFYENGIPFYSDFIWGQKTGFFLDQRNNRYALRRLSKEKVLDLFGYTGSFSIYALLSGAKEVTIVDSSARALDILHQNMKINQLSNYSTICMDVKDFLRENKESYDFIIVDPPSFAKHIEHIPQALRTYKWINAQAMKITRREGFIMTFSCSQAISMNLFLKMLYEAGQKVKREIHILQFFHQPEDHPINVFHQETNYLKGCLLLVI